MRDQDKTKDVLIRELQVLRAKVDELKTLEHKCLVAAEQLHRERASYEAIFESVNDAILVLDMDSGRILEVNRKGLEMFGHPPSRLKKMKLEALGAEDPPHGGEDVPGRLRAAAEAPQLFEWLVQDRAGRRFWVEVNLKRALMSGKDRILAVVRDIQNRKAEEERLRRFAAELERSNRELEQFARVASHDLQEPLITIIGLLQLLARKYAAGLPPKGREILDRAEQGARHLQHLIQDLLAYSRVDAARAHPEPVDCERVLGQVLEALDGSIRESGARVTHDPLPRVTGDPSLLFQLFQNLISNAIKFRGEAPPRVHVSAAREDGRWVFSVADNGIGIAPKDFDRIFDIFQRLHPRRKYPGTGIGLSTCKKIVDLHGGRIWVESEPGRGATFRFTLAGGPGSLPA
ncbi:PAS domain S-box protein, partial [Dissulfurirhabdus thermomarina]